MPKNNKLKLIISSLIMLLPMVFGIIFWNDLGEKMVIHWGIDGNADGFANRAFCVFGLPLIMLGLHWLSLLVIAATNKHTGQSSKILSLVFFLVPAISLPMFTAIYSAALGYDVPIFSYMIIMLAILFFIIGNYMPKCRQNHSIGIRIKWTLENEENWNATHRFAGRLWTAGSIVLLLCALLPESICLPVFFAVLMTMCIIPIAYSYSYHKKHLEE